MSYRKYPIDEHDRLYLHNFLKPYLKRDLIYAIYKRTSPVNPSYSYLAITTNVDETWSLFHTNLYPSFNLPAFESEKMFIGLDEDVAYGPDELGVDRLTTEEVRSMLTTRGFKCDTYNCLDNPFLRKEIYYKCYGSICYLYYSLINKKVSISNCTVHDTQVSQTLKQVKRLNKDLEWLKELNLQYDGYNDIY